MKRVSILVTALLCITISGLAKAADASWRDTSLSFEERAWALVDELTLEEKVGQMMHDAPAIERLGIPAYNWWNEALHGVARSGYATVFPQAIGMASTFNTKLMAKTADVISTEARAKYHETIRKDGYTKIYYGLTYWSPNINIFRDPRWGRGQETYGEDPYLTGQMGMEFVKGLQGNDKKYLKLVATPKHYAVHSGPEPLRHTFNAIPTMRDLYETYLPAFEDLIVKTKAYSIMGAYNRVDGESASASYMLLKDILRDKWGFDGYVVSDCAAIEDIWLNHKIVDTAAEAATLGARRGCDLNCGVTYKALIEAIELGIIEEDEIDLNLYRLMLAKMKLGMFDPDDMVKYSKIPFSANDSPENSQVALDMGRESIVLLKNDNLLPIDKSKIKTIAVIGPNADSIDVLLGNYNGIPSKPVTVLQGIKDAVGDDVEVLYAQGSELVDGYFDSENPELVTPDYRTGRGPGAVKGLKVEFFNNTGLSGEPVYSRIEEHIDHRWDMGSPTDREIAQGIISRDKAVNEDNFSARWTGTIAGPADPTTNLVVCSDDGVRIYINGELMLEDWTGHATQYYEVETGLQPGEVADIVIEYYEGEVTARFAVGWKSPAKDTSYMANDAKAAANKADVVLFVGGLSAKLEGEEMPVNLPGFVGGDRTNIALPDSQLNMLKELHATGKPVVFVMLTGSAIGCQWSEDNIPAIVCGWYPGQNGGTAIADVLFGKYNPAGRLPITFYKSADQLGDFEDYNMSGKTYRYFDGEPLYAFGHGLSYTKFGYSDLKINKKTFKPNDTIKVSFTVTNTGKVDGDEVVQLYVRDVQSSVPMPIKQLRSFDRIHLKAGKSKKVTMTLKPSEDMRYYKPQIEDYTVEPGDFEIQVGAASDDIRLKGVVTVK